MYLGDHCATNIIINDILAIKKPKLFMLGGFRFDDIIKYLSEQKLEEIYDKKYLKAYHDKDISLKFKSIEKKHDHCPDVNNCIINIKYNFIFHHDFMFVKENNTIMNYNYIVNQYNTKIKNTFTMFNNENPIIFINFVWNDEIMYNVYKNNDKVIEMQNILKKYIPHKPFYILFFTNNQNININVKNVLVVKLKNNYESWIHNTPKENIEIYTEIYNAFYNATIKLNLQHHFPSFENTHYYKNVVSS